MYLEQKQHCLETGGTCHLYFPRAEPAVHLTIGSVAVKGEVLADPASYVGCSQESREDGCQHCCLPECWCDLKTSGNWFCILSTSILCLLLYMYFHFHFLSSFLPLPLLEMLLRAVFLSFLLLSVSRPQAQQLSVVPKD